MMHEQKPFPPTGLGFEERVRDALRRGDLDEANRIIEAWSESNDRAGSMGVPRLMLRSDIEALLGEARKLQQRQAAGKTMAQAKGKAERTAWGPRNRAERRAWARGRGRK